MYVGTCRFPCGTNIPDNLSPFHSLSDFDRVTLIVSVGCRESTPVFNEYYISTRLGPARIAYYSISGGSYGHSRSSRYIHPGMEGPLPAERIISPSIGRADIAFQRIP